MAGNKVAAYLGLARKAGKLTLGTSSVETLRGGVYLLVADPSASENTKKKIEKLKRKFACPLVEVEELGALVGKEGRMIAAVREENLAKAMIAACKE